ncbi:MAG: hypothetical protein GY938_13295, partial [Ketobacter sp.]|nr:hypothetical protein [Ketobacter sp.]
MKVTATMTITTTDKDSEELYVEDEEVIKELLTEETAEETTASAQKTEETAKANKEDTPKSRRTAHGLMT